MGKQEETNSRGEKSKTVKDRDPIDFNGEKCLLKSLLVAVRRGI